MVANCKHDYPQLNPEQIVIGGLVVMAMARDMMDLAASFLDDGDMEMCDNVLKSCKSMMLAYNYLRTTHGMTELV